MILAILSLLSCQLLGEVVSRALGLPVPGPVLGMVFLAALLIWRGRLPDELGRAADFLLSHLALFFVPAAVGVIANGGRIAQEFLPLAASVLISTALALAVAAIVFQAVDKRFGHKGPAP
jgi:holin-like protein